MNARRGLQGIGAALVATAVMFSTPVAIAATRTAAQARASDVASGATDFSARRVYRRYVARPYYPPPVYYARPYYYRPYPYAVPAPFFLGFGYLPYY